MIRVEADRAEPVLRSAEGGGARVAHVANVDSTLRFLLLPQLERLRDEGFEVITVSAPGPWVRRLEAAGIRHVPWPSITRAWTPAGDVRALAELVRILRDERADIVHTHTPKAAVLGRLAGRLASVRSIVNTVHGLYATPEDRLAKRMTVLAVERMAALLSDLELYQSQEDLEWVRRRRVVGRDRSALLGNGIDLGRFDPSAVSPSAVARIREELGIPEGSRVVGTVGRLVAEKGYREFFAAAAAVRAAYPDVHFLAVGAPDDVKSDAIGRAEIGAARGDVVVTGWREDVRDLLALMDVFVLASWREGLPRSAIEAAAMAKPMVLTNVRGCREVVRDGSDGLLVPPRDPRALTAAVMRFLQDPELRTRTGAAARAGALERFDERVVADTILASYRRLLMAPRTGRNGHPPSPVRAGSNGYSAPAPGAAKGHAGNGSTPAGGLMVRRAIPRDVPAIARLHMEGLPDAFLPTLGEPFLRTLYRGVIEDRDALALVADNGTGVVGFATGVVSVRAFYRRFFLRHGLTAGASAAPRLLRLSVLRRVDETARYLRKMSRLPEAELLSIAVAPRFRGQHVASSLAEGIRSWLEGSGVGEMKVVVAAGNEGANRFYEQLGFRPVGRVSVHEGQESRVWVIGCRSSSPSA